MGYFSSINHYAIYANNGIINVFNGDDKAICSVLIKIDSEYPDEYKTQVFCEILRRRGYNPVGEVMVSSSGMRTRDCLSSAIKDGVSKAILHHNAGFVEISCSDTYQRVELDDYSDTWFELPLSKMFYLIDLIVRENSDYRVYDNWDIFNNKLYFYLIPKEGDNAI